MGWNVYDYPSAPRETGVEADSECQACGLGLPGDDCWQCADCFDDFCESHILDLLDADRHLLTEAEDGGSVFVCERCRLRRLEPRHPAAANARAEASVA